MTYARGSKVLPSDYDNFTGGQDPTVAFASSAAATNKASALFGVGYGDRGYGQTGISISAKSSGTKVLASDWANLRSMINICALHQGTATTLLPPAPSTGNSLVAHEQDAPSLNAYDYQDMLANIDANRFNTNNGASMTLTANALTITRSTTWSTNIYCSAIYNFVTEDQARYFFNSGGEIRVTLSQTTQSNSQSINWGTVFSNIGTVAIKANTTTRSGTIGIPQNSGYYQQILNTYVMVFNGTNIGTGAYSSNDVYIYTYGLDSPGPNGGKGYRVLVQINLQDQHTGPSDIVNVGTTATFGFLKATSPLSGIVTPTVTQNVPWTVF
jgi:hypothetical protein